MDRPRDPLDIPTSLQEVSSQLGLQLQARAWLELHGERDGSHAAGGWLLPEGGR